MKKQPLAYLLFLLIALLHFSCGSNGLNNNGKVWISTADSPPGLGFSLGVLDFRATPYSSYIVSHQEEKTTVFQHEDSIFIDTSFLGRVVYEQDSFMVLTDEHNNSKHYHVVPDLNNSDSLDFVFDFLVSNSLLYQDENIVLKVQYEPSVNSSGWNESISIDSLRQIDMTNFNEWIYSFDYNFFRRWHLTTLNNTIILLNSPEFLFDGFALDILIVEEIYESKLVARKLEIPFWKRNSMHDSIYKGVNINFQYEKCVFEKQEGIHPEVLSKMYDRICKKTWTSQKADSVTYIGKGFIPRHDTVTRYPKSLSSFSYKFFPDRSYEISLDSSISTGVYEFSRDGDYILLDKAGENPNCLKIRLLSSDTLSLQHLINITSEGRGYNRHNCYLTLQ